MHSKATVFEFTSYKFEPLEKRVIFNYKTEFTDENPLHFTESVVLPKIPDLKNIPAGLIEKLLQDLHIILGISYYKLYCATKVKISYELTKKEADFWNTIYKKGLGEFFYRNNLDPSISPKFAYKKNYVSKPISCVLNPKSLVAIGGGKDSIVSAELLKEGPFDFETFFIETNKESALVKNIASLIGKPNLKVTRLLDKKVFGNHQYAGHIPISAIYAFIGTFTAALYGFSYFIVSNEYSSNFGNTTYMGEEINHQWSKSFEFEKLFQGYLRNIVNVSYFSLMRPFYEIRIAKLFSKYPEYFSHFSSCNSNFKIREGKESLWCCHCPKCIFTFILLSAHLGKKEVVGIFGKNLYEDKNLLPLFKDILGLGDLKPFDCVGTFEEAQSAMFLVKKHFRDSFMVKELSNKIKFHPEVFLTQKESSVPEQFNFSGMDSALILGYGREGQITRKYIRKYYPKIKIGIADEKQGKDYLKKQGDFDIAIKTPGIKKELVEIPHTTATNIFFSRVSGKNTIIGITGSKGKSTTSSLIYEILKTSGKRVELLGNIGNPMLEALLKPLASSTIFVLELSSYQLDDIKFSPDIAVVTSLFPEHMDYHGSIKSYFNAKKNIINFQDKSSFLVYNPKSSESKEWTKNYMGKAVPFDSESKFETKLIGEHNKENIRAAISAAKILGISKKDILKAVKNFKGLPHRMEFIGEFKGIKFYDDAISTNPDSTIMAIKSINDIDTILLGGENRGYNFSQLEKTVKKYKIRNIVLFPDSGSKIIRQKSGFNILKTRKMDDAIKFAYKNTKRGGVCLLSCASPSYSLWKSFEEKGDQFKKYVKKFSK